MNADVLLLVNVSSQKPEVIEPVFRAGGGNSDRFASSGGESRKKTVIPGLVIDFPSLINNDEVVGLTSDGVRPIEGAEVNEGTVLVLDSSRD